MKPYTVNNKYLNLGIFSLSGIPTVYTLFVPTPIAYTAFAVVFVSLVLLAFVYLVNAPYIQEIRNTKPTETIMISIAEISKTLRAMNFIAVFFFAIGVVQLIEYYYVLLS